MDPKAQAPAEAEAAPAEEASTEKAEEAPEEEEKLPTDEEKRRTNMIIFFTCAAIVFLALLSIILNSLAFNSMKSREMEFAEPFDEMKKKIATVYHDNQLEEAEPKEIADLVLQETPKIKVNRRLYPGIKEQYQDILYEKMPYKLSTPWQFFRDARYYFSMEVKDWYSAEVFCISIGGHLASILDTEEQKFITSTIRNYVWIGLHNQTKMLLWTDGQAFVVEYWTEPRNQPPNTSLKENCVAMVPKIGTNNWILRHCYRRYRWVCKDNKITI